MTANEEINFICPYCNKEVQDDDELVFDLENKVMVHIACIGVKK